MASYYIFSDISTNAGRTLMVWKAKLVFGLQSNQVPTPIYQTQINRPIIPNQIYWINFFLWDQTKFIPPTLPNEIHQTKSTKSNLPSKMFEI